MECLSTKNGQKIEQSNKKNKFQLSRWNEEFELPDG